jgi:electron transport complex protein RnfE
MREILAQGTLFADADIMLGEWASTLVLIEDYNGFLLAALPPGAFIGLGFILAIKNIIDDRLSRRSTSHAQVSVVLE